MKTLCYLLSRVPIYWEAFWAFLHPLKIMEAELDAQRLFNRIEIAGMKKRLRDLENRQ